MGKRKGDFFSPRAISNRMKARSLQKLRFYCQMCEKQCRDANGFKCHIQSEGHLRQMAVFKANSSKILSDFSRQFESQFLQVIRGITAFTRMTQVYSQVIRNKTHVHMNATRWGTLTGFCGYLEDTGKIDMEEREDGIYIRSKSQLNSKKVAADALLAKRRKELSEEKRRLRDFAGRKMEEERVEMKRKAATADVNKLLMADEPISLSISMVKKKKSKLMKRKKRKKV